MSLHSKADEVGIAAGSPRRSVLPAVALGLCPALAVSYRVDNAIVMGLTVLAVFVLSSLSIGALGLYIPSKFRFALELIVASAFATVADLLLQAFVPDASTRLGIYVPVVGVNCMILGRSGRLLGRDRFKVALRDSTGMGGLFALSLIVIALVREILGHGTISLFAFGTFEGKIVIPGISQQPVSAFGYSIGALLVLGYLLAASNWLFARRGVKRS
ncbi:MAG TPA: Rnf-Nqr domain containing protein [Spirochaetia bacterium]|nr:Rnf-Nqr domain containing protein [Spirochaetia bacterium]